MIAKARDVTHNSIIFRRFKEQNFVYINLGFFKTRVFKLKMLQKITNSVHSSIIH